MMSSNPCVSGVKVKINAKLSQNIVQMLICEHFAKHAIETE